jgi:hypothetical protein
MKKNKVYFNDGQRYLLCIGANSETIIAARRFGKSDGIIAPRLLRNAQHMPRSAGAFYAATFQQALSRTLPAAVAALERWGYMDGKHFFIGKKAPDRLGFEQPYIKPKIWDHCIHWYDGSVVNILSQDVRFSANSLTLDYLIADEARSIKKDKFFNEAIPAVSGVIGHFDNIPWHKGITLVSDMPQGKEGEWLLNRKSDMDQELIDSIEGTLSYIQELKGRTTEFAKNELYAQNKFLREARSKAHIYKEFDAIENIELLGEDYIKKQKRELTPLIFLTCIMNKRITKLTNGFYPNLDADKHYYDAFNNSYLNNLRTPEDSFDLKKFSKLNCLQDDDIDPEIPLHITCDYNANINWIVTGQPIRGELRTLKSMYVKNQEKLRKLLENWAEYYAPIKNKDIVYYYNSTALDKGYADEKSESFKEIVISTLSAKGFNVYDKYIGKTMKHHLKHQYIDDALTGKQYLYPRFNRFHNEALLPAMETTGVRVGPNGFQKDKSGEKLEETEDNLLERRTDGTDAWDDLFIGCNFFPVTGISRFSTASVFSK